MAKEPTFTLKEVASTCGIGYDSCRALNAVGLSERGFERVARGRYRRTSAANATAPDMTSLKLRKLEAETRLLDQRYRDNAVATYYAWCEHLAEKAAPAIAEYRNEVEKCGLNEDQRKAINEAFEKWMNSTFRDMLADLPPGLFRQASPASD